MRVADRRRNHILNALTAQVLESDAPQYGPPTPRLPISSLFLAILQALLLPTPNGSAESYGGSTSAGKR